MIEQEKLKRLMIVIIAWLLSIIALSIKDDLVNIIYAFVWTAIFIFIGLKIVRLEWENIE